MSSQRVPGGVVHNLPTDPRTALLGNALLSTVGMTSPLARNDFICWAEDAKKDDNRACLRVDGASMRTSGSIGV